MALRKLTEQKAWTRNWAMLGDSAGQLWGQSSTLDSKTRGKYIFLKDHIDAKLSPQFWFQMPLLNVACLFTWGFSSLHCPEIFSTPKSPVFAFSPWGCDGRGLGQLKKHFSAWERKSSYQSENQGQYVQVWSNLMAWAPALCDDPIPGRQPFTKLQLRLFFSKWSCSRFQRDLKLK